jgi:tetratricopeptide (TPR) repeat protein
LYYKVALTYYKEGQMDSAIRQLEAAMRIHRMQPEYNLLMGECKLQQGKIKDAVVYFSNVVRARPRSSKGWEALIRCLVKAGFTEEALEQAVRALEATGAKPLFVYYYSAILFFSGKSKEALLQLENALQANPKLLRKFFDLYPQLMRSPQVIDLVVKYKRAAGRRKRK